MKAVTITLVAVGLILLASFIAITVTGKEVTKALSQGVISPAEFQSVPFGETKQAVIDRFGSPTGGIYSETVPRNCIVYDRSDRASSGPNKRVYQFCFWRNRLDAKSPEIAATAYGWGERPAWEHSEPRPGLEVAPGPPSSRS